MDLLDDEDVKMETREASPSHLLLRIESFTFLEKYGINKYQSNEFASGDYKWKLVVYPNGDKSVTEHDHVSVYLALANTSSMASKWEVNAIFSLFLYNHIADNYLATQAKMKRFVAMKPKRGVSEFISKKVLTDPSNGYIVDNSCVFGVEVFPITSQPLLESLSLLRTKEPYTRGWKICEFSKLEDLWTSDDFVVGDYTWKIILYPKGYGRGVGRFASIYLCYVNSNICAPDQKVLANYRICVGNEINDQHCKLKSSCWFSSSMTREGSAEFMPLAGIDDPKKGFIVEDSCIVEIEIVLQGIGCRHESSAI